VKPCKVSMVLRYRHPNALPEIEGVHWTASPAYTQAGKVKQAYPNERVTVLQDGYEEDIKP
jgi:hypothetical protein